MAAATLALVYGKLAAMPVALRYDKAPQDALAVTQPSPWYGRLRARPHSD